MFSFDFFSCYLMRRHYTFDKFKRWSIILVCVIWSPVVQHISIFMRLKKKAKLYDFFWRITIILPSNLVSITKSYYVSWSFRQIGENDIRLFTTLNNWFNCLVILGPFYHVGNGGLKLVFNTIDINVKYRDRAVNTVLNCLICTCFPFIHICYIMR